MLEIEQDIDFLLDLIQFVAASTFDALASDLFESSCIHSKVDGGEATTS